MSFAAEIADTVSALNATRSAWRRRQTGRYGVSRFPEPAEIAK